MDEQLSSKHVMQEEEEDPSALTPEELVSMASDAYDVEKQEVINREALSKCDDDDDCKKNDILPPPELQRGHNITRTSTPGAFRLGNSMNDVEEEARTDDQLVLNPPLPDSELNLKPVVEATLVTEGTTTSDEDTRSFEVYDAEPLDKEMPSSSSALTTRCFCIAVTALVAVAAVAVAIAVVVSSKNDDDDPSSSVSLPALITEAPTISPETRLRTYNRITHHAALLKFLMPQTCDLRSDGEVQNSMAAVTLKCGASDGIYENEAGWLSSSDTSSDSGDDEKPAIVLLEAEGITKSSCVRLGKDMMQCYVVPKKVPRKILSGALELQQASIVFTCGTSADEFPVGIETNKTTATVRIEEIEANCSDSGNKMFRSLQDNGGEQQPDLDQLPPGKSSIVSMLALGRLCRPPKFPNPKIFHAVRECYRNLVVDFELGGDNTTEAVATYCYSQHMSCPGEQCVFELHGVMAHDRSTAPHCEAETLEDSLLDAALIGADIAELLKGEATFLEDWIQSNEEEYYN